MQRLERQYDVQKLRERIEELEAEVAYLRDAFAPSVSTPPEWGLSVSEDRIFGSLLTRRIVSREALMAALYSLHGGEIPDPKTVEVFLSFMRRKLRPHGIVICNKWGRGWYLEPAERERLRAQLLSDGA